MSWKEKRTIRKADKAERKRKEKEEHDKQFPSVEILRSRLLQEDYEEIKNLLEKFAIQIVFRYGFWVPFFKCIKWDVFNSDTRFAFALGFAVGGGSKHRVAVVFADTVQRMAWDAFRIYGLPEAKPDSD